MPAEIAGQDSGQVSGQVSQHDSGQNTLRNADFTVNGWPSNVLIALARRRCNHIIQIPAAVIGSRCGGMAQLRV